MLFLHFQRASISKYISYRQETPPRQQIIEIIKGIDTAGNINQDTFSHWKDLMSEHNRIVERGEQMMLLRIRAANMKWIKFGCLDLFMLQMQSRYLAKLLDEFSSFGERVLLLIQESPTSLFWTLGHQIGVELTSWSRLCGQMMTLVHVLGVADPSFERLRLSPWPDRELLEAAAARAKRVFGRFALADTAMPSVRALLFPANEREGPASGVAAEEPHRRAAKRGREDSKPPGGTAAAAVEAGGSCWLAVGACGWAGERAW